MINPPDGEFPIKKDGFLKKPQTFEEVMSIDTEMNRDEPPTFAQLKELANQAQSARREVGVLVVRRKLGSIFNPDYKYRTVYRRGQERSFPPGFEIPIDLYAERTEAISLHSHPDLTDSFKPEEGFTYVTFPSLNDMDGATGTNTFSKEGVVFCIGREQVVGEKQIEVVKAKKFGFSYNTTREVYVKPYWEIWKGSNPEFRSENLFAQIEQGHRFTEPVKKLTFTYPQKGVRKNLLFVKWDILLDLEKNGLTTQDIFFGSGVDTLVSKVGIDIPHQENLKVVLDEPIRSATKY